MKKLISILQEKLEESFKKCGYDAKYAKVIISNRPDLCEFQCDGALAAAKEYKKAHEKRMKTERKSRQKKYHDMLNSSRNCVADELMFTASPKFFDGMTREQIKEWADTCMEFVYNDLGYTKDQILHSVVHLDEKTPHIHCVVVPLVKK